MFSKSVLQNWFSRGGFSLHIFTHESHLVYNQYNRDTKVNGNLFVSYSICQYDSFQSEPTVKTPIPFPKINESYIDAIRNSNPIFATDNGLLNNIVKQSMLVQCPKGHFTWNFMAHDPNSYCCKNPERLKYNSKFDLNHSYCDKEPKMFQCETYSGLSEIPYSLVCNGKEDCIKKTDENFCIYKDCFARGLDCGFGHCLFFSMLCLPGAVCLNRRNEDICSTNANTYGKYFKVPSKPNKILFEDDNIGGLVRKTLLDNKCPETHFQCWNSHCLPLSYYCNGVKDCPSGEDEGGFCFSFSCPGYYKCYKSQACIHPMEICDDDFDCAQGDDEKYCQLKCPSDQCTCQGFEYLCSKPVPDLLRFHPLVRFFDGSKSMMTLADFQNHYHIVHLNLSYCNIQEVIRKPVIHNLRELDLSFNNIKVLNPLSFLELLNLRNLILSYNPIIKYIKASSKDNQGIHNFGIKNQNNDNQLYYVLNNLKISGLTKVDTEVLAMLNPEVLDLSNSSFKILPSLQLFKELHTLDLKDSSVVNFDRNVFLNLKKLHTIYSSNYKLCCSQILPEQVTPKNCFAPTDEISSCENLLR